MVDTRKPDMNPNEAISATHDRRDNDVGPQSIDRRAKMLGIAAGLGAAAIWGGMSVVSKQMLDVVPPLTLVFLRVAIGTVTLAAIALVTRAPRVALRDLPFMALLGFIGLFISMVVQFIGTKLSTAAYGALITSAVPVFLILFTWPILGEKPTRRRIIGLVLATVGVIATIALDARAQSELGTESSSVLMGNVLLVVAAVTWALYSVLSQITARRYPVLVTTLYATGFGTIFNALIVPFGLRHYPTGEISPTVILGILYLGVVSTAGAFYLWNKSIALLGASIPAILFFAQPVVGGLLGALLLNETLGLAFAVGGSLILLAVLITARE